MGLRKITKHFRMAGVPAKGWNPGDSEGNRYINPFRDIKENVSIWKPIAS
jgi:hypothetical protein